MTRVIFQSRDFAAKARLRPGRTGLQSLCENWLVQFEAALPPDLRKACGFPASGKPFVLRISFSRRPERLSLSASQSGLAASFHINSSALPQNAPTIYNNYSQRVGLAGLKPALSRP
jgi:hypothetical protein